MVGFVICNTPLLSVPVKPGLTFPSPKVLIFPSLKAQVSVDTEI